MKKHNGEKVTRKHLRKVKKKWVVAATTAVALIGAGGFYADADQVENAEVESTKVHKEERSASNWSANTVEQVKNEVAAQKSENANAYEIQWGDTLWALSQATGISVSDLAAYNNIVNPDLIYADDHLAGVLSDLKDSTKTVEEVRAEVESVLEKETVEENAVEELAEAVEKEAEEVEETEEAALEEETEPEAEAEAEEIVEVEEEPAVEEDPAEKPVEEEQEEAVKEVVEAEEAPAEETVEEETAEEIVEEVPAEEEETPASDETEDDAVETEEPSEGELPTDEPEEQSVFEEAEPVSEPVEEETTEEAPEEENAEETAAEPAEEIEEAPQEEAVEEELPAEEPTEEVVEEEPAEEVEETVETETVEEPSEEAPQEEVVEEATEELPEEEVVAEEPAEEMTVEEPVVEEVSEPEQAEEPAAETAAPKEEVAEEPQPENKQETVDPLFTDESMEPQDDIETEQSDEVVVEPESQVGTPQNFIIPAEGRITSGYGYRKSPLTGENKLHAGIDIAGGGLVVAAQGGTVVKSEYHEGWGNYVKIDHGNGVETLYAHMQDNSVMVSEGDVIDQGAHLGIMGTTGASTGVHLHFEVHINGVQVDPAPYLYMNV